MDNRPIGFFDSGLGGLTCIPYLMKALPKEKIIYFGDTARTPYGSKSPATIKTFSVQIADFLVHNNVKMIVIACNTVTSTCLTDLQERHPTIPIIGIIQPAVDKVVNVCTVANSIGIIGTKVTIRNKTYNASIEKQNPKLHIYATACPTFVPLIEEGIIQHEIMDLTIKYYLDQFISYNKIDTLVLGCTHYPLIRQNIEKIYPNLQIIDPSEEIISSIEKVLTDNDLYSESSDLDNTFYASDLSENFINMINRIFENSEFKVAFKNFDLEIL
jgi:glutamate racemase